MGRAPRISAVFPLFAVLCSVLFSPSRASEPQDGWIYFTNNSDVRALYEDGDTLWVATNGGVLLVNALTGEVVSTLTVLDGLADNSARTFYGESGRIYIGTDGGVDVCRRTRGARLSIEPVGRFADVRYVGSGPSGSIHVGTYGHGAARIDRTGITWITTADSLIDDKVFRIEEVDERSIFYATSLGLCARLDSAWVSFRAGSGLPRGEVRDLARSAGPALEMETAWERSAPDLYVLVAGSGVSRFDGTRAREVSSTAIIDGREIAAIGLAKDGSLWAAGNRGGIGRHRDGVWTRLGDGDEAIENARWRSLHVGASGIVYFGSADGVIAAADDRGVRKISIPSDLASGYIGSAAEAPGGRKYLANGPYLLSIQNNAPAFTTEKDFGSVLAISVSPNGGVWVASRWGLYRSGAGGWEEVVPDVDPRPPLFASLAFDSAGSLWAGSQSGEVYRFDGELWMRLSAPGELTETAVDRLAVDGDGWIWAGAGLEGIFAFDGSLWRRFPNKEFDGAEVVDLSVDRSGRAVALTRGAIWRHTRERGWGRTDIPGAKIDGDFRTIRFDSGGRWYLVTSKGLAVGGEGATRWLAPSQGLRGKDVTSILIDGDGFLWVGFRSDGLSRISLAKLR